MNEYTLSLFLLYIKEAGTNYDFTEAKQMLGMSHAQLEELISNLKGKEYLDYVEYSLKITEKGLRYLISRNAINYSANDKEYVVNIHTSQLPIDEVFVPKDFDKKYCFKK